MTLTDAVARYHAAHDTYRRAAEDSALLRRTSYTRAARAANEAARTTRTAWEAARDELVAAALEHTGV